MRAERHGGSRTMFLTIVISTLLTIVIGSLLYYTFKRHDLIYVQDMERMAAQSSEQKAIAAGQIFAAISRSIVQSDVARVQILVESALHMEGLRDVMIINKDNVVLAAKNHGQIGQKLQDSTWLSWKSQNREVTQRAVSQSGQPVFVIVEPLRDNGDVLAWAMLVFEAAPGAAALRSPMERSLEVSWLMAPILLFLLIGIRLAMKLAAAAIQKQIQGIMASVLDERSEPGGKDWLRKVS